MKKKGEETKKKIFNVATELYSKHGYTNVSLRDICSRLGITDGAIYNYYESKDDILEDIFAVFHEKIKEYMQPMKKEEMRDSLRRGKPRMALNRCVIKLKDEDVQFIADAFRIMIQGYTTNETAHRIALYEIHDELAENVKYTVDELVKRGRIPPLDTDAFSLIWARNTLTSISIWVSHIYHEGPHEEDSIQFERTQKHLIEWAMGERGEDSPPLPPRKKLQPMSELPNEFKARLQWLMERNQISQTDLAIDTGMSRQVICYYLSGRNYPIKLKMKYLADYFDVDIEWLAGEKPKKEAPRK